MTPDLAPTPPPDETDPIEPGPEERFWDKIEDRSGDSVIVFTSDDGRYEGWVVADDNVVVLDHHLDLPLCVVRGDETAPGERVLHGRTWQDPNQSDPPPPRLTWTTIGLPPTSLDARPGGLPPGTDEMDYDPRRHGQGSFWCNFIPWLPGC